MSNSAWAILLGWPYPSYNKADFDNPIGLADSSQIPIVNTCLEPMKISIDSSRVTGGVLPTGIGQGEGCNLPPWKGQWYEVIATIPYTLTCGNGVQYNAETRLTSTDLLKSGCDHRGRPTTWPSKASIDENGLIRGMWWDDEDGDSREIGVGIGIPGLTFDVAAVKKSYLGATCILPSYKGGKKKLTRPIAFIHGLDMGFDDTWGVKGAICTPVTGSIKPNEGAVRQSRMKWSFGQAPGNYTINVDAIVRFHGTCQAAAIQDNWNGTWESEWKSLFSFDVSPGTLYNTEIPQWTELVKNDPPIVKDVKVINGTLRGMIEFWTSEEFTSKMYLFDFARHVDAYLDSKTIGGSKFIKIRLEFLVQSDSIDWNHSTRARDNQSIQGTINKEATGSDPYESGTAPDVVSRLHNLRKGTDINDNGIYFFNGYRWNADSGRMIQPLPWWNDAGADFPSGQPGESWSLYQFLEYVLDMHYGMDWRKDSTQTIDLVCHSRGGISLREMLANAAGNRPNSWGGPMPKGVLNAANHIRKVVTVNTPHFGSVTTTDLNNLPSEYSDSHGQILALPDFLWVAGT